MEYKVLKSLTIKFQGVEQIIQPGTVITITEGQAARLLEAGKVAPIRRTSIKEDQPQDPVQKPSFEAESQEMGSSQTAKGDFKVESGRSEPEGFQKRGSQSVQEELWELFSFAVPGKINPDLFRQSDNPYLEIFRKAYARICEIYEPGLIPFIRREHPERLEPLVAIRKELDRLYSIQAAYPRRRVKSEFRRFEEQTELWRQWFYHPLYLFIHHESTAEQKEEKMEEEILEKQDREEPETDIEVIYEKYLDDLQCFHDCEHYGSQKCGDLCHQ